MKILRATLTATRKCRVPDLSKCIKSIFVATCVGKYLHDSRQVKYPPCVPNACTNKVFYYLVSTACNTGCILDYSSTSAAMPFNWLCQCFWPDRHNSSSESQVAAEARHKVRLEVYVILFHCRRRLRAALKCSGLLKCRSSPVRRPSNPQ